jgi:hypothetical protein
MNWKYKITSRKLKVAKGYALPLVLVVMLILIILCFGETMTSYTTRIQAVSAKAETEAMLAAEAGYEKAIFWMCQQSDILGAMQTGGGSGVINFDTSTCSYEVGFEGFLGSRPVFSVKATGKSGRPVYTRIVDVNVMQETSGWAMGACRIPNGPSLSDTLGVNFIDGEVIDIPLHINKASDNPDRGDIFISGNPTFLRAVEMGESRKRSGVDKSIYTSYSNGSLSYRGTYSDVIPLFENGISFDQPNIRITDSTAVQSKVNRFRDSTAAAYKFTPASPTSPMCSAAQIEFFVQGGIGKVRIDPNCTVQLHNYGSFDYSVVSGSDPMRFQRYNIYAYHYKNDSDSPIIVPVTDTYVSQTFGGYTSEPGGQIFVNGNVVIGGGEDANFTDVSNMVVKGKITIVATGNIWIADSIIVDGSHDHDGMPTVDDPDTGADESNPNVLGIIAQGVIKVVDPGLAPATVTPPAGYTYQPIGIIKPGNTGRYLPDSTVVEAAITVGGGGWGAENVGSRREYSGSHDNLIVRGSITEVIRGVVGLSGSGSNGYIKNYYIDTRLMSGILPGDIWFTGKFIPAPAGWHDYSINDN